MCAPGGRGRRCAECPAGGVAPVEFGGGRGSGAVARRVDHVVRTVGEPRNCFAVTDFVFGGEEVRDIEAEAPRVADTGFVEPVGHVPGAVPLQVSTIDINRGGRIAGQRVDGVTDQVVALFALAT